MKNSRTRRRSIAIAFACAGLMSITLETASFAAAAPNYVAGLRRLTETEYRNSIADIFGSAIDVQGRFEPERRVGGLLASSSAILSITPAGFEGYSKMADSIAAQVVDGKNRGKLISCTPKTATAPDDKCASEVISHYGLMLFRRPLTGDERKARMALAANLAKSSGNFYTGLRYALASLISSPQFLFRVETASGKDNVLDNYSRAARLSYLFWDTTPDAELLGAAQSGALAAPDGVSRQVDRLMASPRLETGMRAFFADYFELDTFGNITKDPTIYPKFMGGVADSAKEETLRSAIDLTLKRGGDVRDLMTTRKTFINRTLASIYGVPFNFKSDWVGYEFPEDAGRSGLLTQVSMLGMFSHPGRSSPTKRGVAVLDIFLCQPTPNPPPNVDFSIINDVSNPTLKTVRQRLMAHATNAVCASCHTHSDPIGLSLDQFDSIGVRRVQENNEPIDVSATLQGQHFVGATGLGQVLHDNPKVAACFARKMYAYGVGASSERVSAAMVRAPLDSFTAGGYRLPVLLRALATSPQFFSAPPPEAPKTKTAMNAVSH
jgi:hypothetical protein